ncbi:peptide-binding protein [Planctomycetales bacterium]|nr:peptide-binding protein [Planctomycetales bacterium]
MALVTIRVLDGPERGRTFHQVAAPVTIGRESGNFIQLSDERVSRYHIKIHEHSGVMLLTDLQSTNGTKVNGETVHTWQLRPGDLITVGQSVLVFGSTEEIAARLTALRRADLQAAVMMGANGEEMQLVERTLGGASTGAHTRSSQLLAKEIYQDLEPEELNSLQLLFQPNLPTNLTPVQTAQLEEFTQYIHLRLRYLVATVRSEDVPASNGGDDRRITLSASQWQNLLDLHGVIALMLNKIAEP